MSAQISSNRTFKFDVLHSTCNWKFLLISKLWRVQYSVSIFSVHFIILSFRFHYMYFVQWKWQPTERKKQIRHRESHRKSLSMPQLLAHSICGRIISFSFAFVVLLFHLILWIRVSWFIDNLYEVRRVSERRRREQNTCMFYLSSAAYDINHWPIEWEKRPPNSATKTSQTE